MPLGAARHDAGRRRGGFQSFVSRFVSRQPGFGFQALRTNGGNARGSFDSLVSIDDRVRSLMAAGVDLAAAYRLVALFHWDDLIYTHISARVPGRDNEFLINPYGLMFEEITASSLVKVDLAGTILAKPDFGALDYGINLTRHLPYEDFGAFNFAIGLF